MIVIDKRELNKPPFDSLAARAYEQYKKECAAAPDQKRPPKSFKDFCDEKGFSQVTDKRPAMKVMG